MQENLAILYSDSSIDLHQIITDLKTNIAENQAALAACPPETTTTTTTEDPYAPLLNNLTDQLATLENLLPLIDEMSKLPSSPPCFADILNLANIATTVIQELLNTLTTMPINDAQEAVNNIATLIDQINSELNSCIDSFLNTTTTESTTTEDPLIPLNNTLNELINNLTQLLSDIASSTSDPACVEVFNL